MFMYAKSESSLNSFSPCVVTKSDTVKNDQIFPLTIASMSVLTRLNIFIYNNISEYFTVPHIMII